MNLPKCEIRKVHNIKTANMQNISIAFYLQNSGMVLVSISMLTKLDMMDSSSLTRNKDLVSIHGLMEESMKDGGTKASSMGLAHIQVKIFL